VFSNSKLKFQPRRLKTKGSSLWVIKEIRTNETTELEIPYSRRTKVVTRNCYNKELVHLIRIGIKLYDIKQELFWEATDDFFYGKCIESEVIIFT